MTSDTERDAVTNGAALAAFLASGVGAFALGIFVILNEEGLFAAPSLYGPAGGVSGRTTLAAATWLITWVVLHRRWNERQLDPRRIHRTTSILTALGVVLTFPPVWSLVG